MDANIVKFPGTTAACRTCPWAVRCNASAEAHSVLDRADLRCSLPLKRNQHIVRQGAPLEYLYVIRSGSAKSYVDTEDGLEQILAFHYPGEILGFDAVANGYHDTSVVALETLALCRFPFRPIEDPQAFEPEILVELMRAGALQIRQRTEHTLLLGQKSAQARFASLLLDLSSRYAARGCSRTEFNLSMARQDIANYLSLAVETVSRLCGDLQANGVIHVERRFVRILSLDKLKQFATDNVEVRRHAKMA